MTLFLVTNLCSLIESKCISPLMFFVLFNLYNFSYSYIYCIHTDSFLFFDLIPLLFVSPAVLFAKTVFSHNDVTNGTALMNDRFHSWSVSFYGSDFSRELKLFHARHF